MGLSRLTTPASSEPLRSWDDSQPARPAARHFGVSGRRARGVPNHRVERLQPARPTVRAARTRVLETARRLGYPGPDPVARSLRTRQARAVGLLLTEELSFAFRDPAALGFLEGLAGACEDAGQGLLLMPASRGDTDVSAVHQASVDGFVVYSVPERDPHLLAVLERPLPTVVADQPMDIDGWTGSEWTTGAACWRWPAPGRARPSADRGDLHAAEQHPLRRLRDPQRQRRASFPVQRERLRGLREGFAEAGVDWAEVTGGGALRALYRGWRVAASELMDAHLGLTRLVCTSDVLALGALRMAEDRNWAVPDNLTVTGFDGVPEAIRAGLTTVLQPVKEKGRTAGQLLLNGATAPSPRSVVLPPS